MTPWLFGMARQGAEHAAGQALDVMGAAWELSARVASIIHAVIKGGR